MGKASAKKILSDIPRPSSSSVMEAFYGGGPAGAEARRPTREIALELIDPNPAQPRRSLDAEALATLTDSIRELGLIQAILVRPVGERYQIVCGERRYRACATLGHRTVRADVREVDEATAYKLALAENIQRDSLTPIDEALGYARLVSEGLSQSDVARALGIDRRRVSEKLVLLDIPAEAQELLSARADSFTERHARVLAHAQAGHPGLDVVAYARRTAEGRWSTRRLERELEHLTEKVEPTGPRLFENLRYALNKRGGFTLTVRARSHQEVARTIAELEEKLAELRAAFVGHVSARADSRPPLRPGRGKGARAGGHRKGG